MCTGPAHEALPGLFVTFSLPPAQDSSGPLGYSGPGLFLSLTRASDRLPINHGLDTTSSSLGVGLLKFCLQRSSGVGAAFGMRQW